MEKNGFPELEHLHLHLHLSKENALGLDVPPYSSEMAKGSGKSGSIYQSKKNLRPRKAPTYFLEDHGYTVMGEESRRIKMVHSLMCLVTHEEHHNGSMTRISKTGDETILLRPYFVMSPTAEFTKEYFRLIISKASKAAENTLKLKAWFQYYEAPEGCHTFKSDQRMVGCASHEKRARQELDRLYSQGQITATKSL
ncbi:hypothetical protein [Microbulbifer sp. ZKSA002]|uniref:hypothetical protein n=1 Tax=Microbulbifer sp. ZKSA002 TaxID=3243388 RepID=UPI004039A790